MNPFVRLFNFRRHWLPRFYLWIGYVPNILYMIDEDGGYLLRLDNPGQGFPRLRFQFAIGVLKLIHFLGDKEKGLSRSFAALDAKNFLHSYMRGDQIRDISAATRAFRLRRIVDILHEARFPSSETVT